VFHELESWYIQVLHKPSDRYCLSPKEAKGYLASGNHVALWQ